VGDEASFVDDLFDFVAFDGSLEAKGKTVFRYDVCDDLRKRFRRA
jgi:hypothetical protein